MVSSRIAFSQSAETVVAGWGMVGLPSVNLLSGVASCVSSRSGALGLLGHRFKSSARLLAHIIFDRQFSLNLQVTHVLALFLLRRRRLL